MNDFKFITNIVHVQIKKTDIKQIKIFKYISFISNHRFINTDGSKPNYLNNFIFGPIGDFKLINYFYKFDI